jgi:o-succinylbenzoate synthase
VIRVARVLEHRRTLRSTARSAAGAWSERTALTLVLEDAAGRAGFGEAAPLPGFSPDELASARRALVPLIGETFPDHARRDVLPALSDAAQPLASASAKMALETALLDLWARQTSVPAWALVRAHDGAALPELALSLWLPHGVDAALSEAQSALARGIRAFKVKLDGRDPSDPGLATLVALRASLGAPIELRADANQSLTPDQARALAPRLAELGILWVEEPTKEGASAELGVPIALDESLVGARPNLSELRAAGVTALVLKPTLLGGLSTCFTLASAARDAGITSVVSHTLEGPLAAMGAAALAHALGSGRPADGLAPHAGLAGARPPCFHPTGDRLIGWRSPGLGVGLSQALLGTTSVEEARA